MIVKTCKRIFLPMLYRVICVCIDLCTLCENNKKINDKKFFMVIFRLYEPQKFYLSGK